MQKLILGTLDSRVELEALARQIGSRPGSRDRFAYFIWDLERLRLNGFQAERAKWIETHRPGMKVFSGSARVSNRGNIRIWAAVEIVDGALGALIKTSDGFRGDPDDFADRLAEATDRFDRGVRTAW